MGKLLLDQTVCVKPPLNAPREIPHTKIVDEHVQSRNPANRERCMEFHVRLKKGENRKNVRPIRRARPYNVYRLFRI